MAAGTSIANYSVENISSVNPCNHIDTSSHNVSNGNMDDFQIGDPTLVTSPPLCNSSLPFVGTGIGLFEYNGGTTPNSDMMNGSSTSIDPKVSVFLVFMYMYMYFLIQLQTYLLVLQ